MLNLGAVVATITVSGASPLVDTTSTATRTEPTRETLDVLPVPGMDSEPSWARYPERARTWKSAAAVMTDTVVFRTKSVPHGECGMAGGARQFAGHIVAVVFTRRRTRG